MSASWNTCTLAVSGMSSDACVQKVRAALRNVHGVTTNWVRIGSATIKCDSQTRIDAACSAISSAGYPTHHVKNTEAVAPKVEGTPG